MGFVLLFALLGIALAGAFGGYDDADPAPSDENQNIEVSDGDTVTGGGGDDMITLALNPDGGSTVSIDGGGGNDLVDLVDPVAFDDLATRDQTMIFDSDVRGGAGDDTIYAAADSSSFMGDDGNDTLIIHGAAITLDGGAGDDIIQAISPDGEAILYGGDGNDILDARQVQGGRVDGGAGDDLLMMTNPTAANQPIYTGGAGNDTLSMAVITPSDGIHEALRVSGGEGDDVFAITINEGGALADGGGTPIDGAVELHAVTIRDFEPGADQLEINASVLDDSYTLSDVTLSTYDHIIDGPSTRVTLVFESEGLIRNVTIELQGTTGVTMDDLVLTGLQTSV